MDEQNKDQEQEQPDSIAAVRAYFEKALAEEKEKTAKAQSELAALTDFVKGMAAKTPDDDFESAIKKYLR